MPERIYILHYLAEAPELLVQRMYFKNVDAAADAGEEIARRRKFQLSENPTWSNKDGAEVLRDKNGQPTFISISREWLY